MIGGRKRLFMHFNDIDTSLAFNQGTKRSLSDENVIDYFIKMLHHNHVIR